MRCQIDRLIEEKCDISFLSDQAYDDHTSGMKSGQKKSIDLQWQNVCVFESQLSLLTHTHTHMQALLSLSLSLSVTPTLI